MNTSSQPPCLLVLMTACLLISMAVTAPLFLKRQLPAAVTLNTKGQPTLGYLKAPIHIVVFEEPKCSNCRLFTEHVYPKIKEAYIDTQEATYTVIPVSFLPGSMPAAIALLCVYHTDPLSPNPDLYFSYLDYMYRNQPGETVDWATSETLVKYATSVSPALSGKSLEGCVSKQAFRQKIQQNTDYGRQIMGGQIATPSVYVNGVEVKELNFETIREVIDEIKTKGRPS